MQNSYSSDQSGVGRPEAGLLQRRRLVHRPVVPAVQHHRFRRQPDHVGEAAAVELPLLVVHARRRGRRGAPTTSTRRRAGPTSRPRGRRWAPPPRPGATARPAATATSTSRSAGRCSTRRTPARPAPACCCGPPRETSTAGWKRFDSAEGTHPPLVSITYNSAPSAPSALAVAPCYTACGSGARTCVAAPHPVGEAGRRQRRADPAGRVRGAEQDHPRGGLLVRPAVGQPGVDQRLHRRLAGARRPGQRHPVRVAGPGEGPVRLRRLDGVDPADRGHLQAGRAVRRRDDLPQRRPAARRRGPARHVHLHPGVGQHRPGRVRLQVRLRHAPPPPSPRPGRSR